MKKEKSAGAIAADRCDGDGLEILSIGSLHTPSSPSHKKYWSSSRGKDRYPYPVGYQAVRTYGNQTFRVEIRQGSTGPLFSVTSTDGGCYSGQTPDMAWENFQKKSVKNCHGRRRLSCVDGVELFGFRNFSVQRLLRELVANVAGASDRSSNSSDLSNKTSQFGNGSQTKEPGIYTKFVPTSGKQKRNSKRARKKEVSLSSNASNLDKSLCRGQPEEEFCSPKQASTFQSGSVEKITPNSEATYHLPNNIAEGQLHLPYLYSSEAHAIFSKNCSKRVQNSAELASISVAPNVPEGRSSSNTFSMVTNGSNVSNMAIPLEEIKLTNPEDSSFQVKFQILPNADRKMSSVSAHAPLDGMDVAAIKDDGREILQPKEVKIGSDIDIHIPGAFGSTKATEDNLAAFSKENRQVINSPQRTDVLVNLECKELHPVGAKDIKKEPTSGSEHPLPGCTITNEEEKNSNEATILVDSEGLILSQPIGGIACDSSNSNSEKADLDSEGQELARSMMTFLLPNAVPLLKRTYQRKRKRVQSQRRKPGSHTVGEQANRLPGDDLASTKLDGFEQIAGEKLHATESPSTTSLMLDPGKVMHSPGFSDNTPFEIESLKKVEVVIPDSFDDDPYPSDARLHIPSHIDRDGTDKSLIGKVIFKHGTTMASSVSELCKEISNCNKSGFCKTSFASETGTGKIICESPSFIDNCTFENLDLNSIDILSNRGEEVAPCLDLVGVSNHVATRMKGSYQGKNSSLSMEHQTVSFKMSMHIVDKESYNVIRTSPNQENNTDTFMANAGVDASSTWNGDEKAKHYGDQANHMIPHPCNEETVLTGTSESLGEFSARELNPSSSMVPELSCSIPIFEKDGDCTFRQKIGIDDVHPAAFSSDVKNANQSSASKNRVTETSLHTTIPKSVCNSEIISGATAPKLQSQEELAVNSATGSKTDSTTNTTTVLRVEPHKTTESGESDSWKAHLLDSKRMLSENMISDFPNASLYHGKDSLVEYISHKKGTLSYAPMCKENTADKQYFSDPKTMMDCQYFVEPIGCYIHPNPVLSMSISAKGTEVVLCVLSGIIESNKRDLFIYRISVEQLTGHPSLLGYTPLFVPSQEGFLGANGKISIERSCMQFYTDAQILAFHSNIKMPCCREQSFECCCSLCGSYSWEESGIKIAHVNFGHVSITAKLVTAGRVYCILICEPNYLIAAEGNGTLHGWKMDPTWRDILEDFVLPGLDIELHLILELKRLPCHDLLIVGHDGEGSFGLWDVCNRVLLGRFSSPGSLILQVAPVCVCCLVKEVASNNLRIEELDKKCTKHVDALFFKNEEDDPLPCVRGECIAVWLFVLASSGSSFPHGEQEQDSRINSAGWRLSLLFKNKAILGSVLDPSASAVESTSGLGVIGTRDGLLYIWDISVGEKMITLDPFKGGKISCIASDSVSGALAVAHENQTLVYIRKPHLPP